jgi:hypothetical protein
MFADIKQLLLEKEVLHFKVHGSKKREQKIKMKQFGKERQQVLETIGRYYARHRAAIEHQMEKHKREKLKQESAGA